MKYTFLNKNTNEVEEHTMRISELDDFKANNPHLERHFTPDSVPVFSDGSRMSTPGIGQPVKAFEQGVIERMKATIPGNTLSRTHKTKLPREW